MQSSNVGILVARTWRTGDRVSIEPWIAAAIDEIADTVAPAVISVAICPPSAPKSLRDRFLSWYLHFDSYRSRRHRTKTELRYRLCSVKEVLVSSSLIFDLRFAEVAIETSTEYWALDVGSESEAFLQILQRSRTRLVRCTKRDALGQFSSAALEFRTHSTSPSINRRNAQRTAIAAMLIWFRAERAGGRPYWDSLEGVSSPTMGFCQLLRLFFRAVRQSFRSKRQRRKVQWTIGWAKNSERPLLKMPSPPSVLHWYQPNAKHFVADPIAFSFKGRQYVFVEEYLYRTHRGRLGCFTFDGRPQFGELKTILEKDFHLSFPFVLTTPTEVLLLPEQASTRTITLYAAEQPEGPFIERRVLLDRFPGVDSVLMFANGRWWLFTSYGGFAAHDTNLHLFSATSLTDEFVPHPLNPVRVGLRGSRMAGPIIENNGKLYRYGQECSVRYGGAVVCFEITKLTQNEYEECEIGEVVPAPASEFPDGCHTVSHLDEIVFFTGQRQIR